MQYGFGDESNSIALVIRTSDRFRLPTSRGGHPVLAKRSWVTGVIKDVEAIDTYTLSEVQTKALEDGQNRLVLETADPINPVQGRNKYYSAYIWVIITVCAPDGRPRFEQPWRNMLTFFEHGNIADETTYLLLKQQLAVKVRSSMEAILRERPEVVLTYACAIDDCGCGQPVEYPPPSGESVRELLFVEPWWARLRAEGWDGRVRTELSGDARVEHAACNLPFVVEEYQNRAQVPESKPSTSRLPHEVAR
ncbi:hypothetical protein [Umezawaea sp. NPDC059074]|uniref:hypothetical protein n=1 Tax=Umezawaea sp. NPDC059074 TaxID=3346716 RepID=UPI00368E8429